MFRTYVIAILLSVALVDVAHAETLPLVPQLAEPSLQERQAQAAALRRKARNETIAGAVLLPLGAALLEAGVLTTLTAGGICTEHCSYGKKEEAQFYAGLALSAIGSAGIVSGIPLLITGAVHKRRANGLDPRLSVAPTLDQRGNLGASANLAFAY